MPQSPIILFVCEHGSAKSVIAAAYFNKLAGEMGLNLKAVARGTHPDQELSPKAVQGLLEDGLQPTESTPQNILPVEAESARRIIAFCELPMEFKQVSMTEQWDDVPPVSENYQTARDAIVEHLNRLMVELE